jgi:hypothetical protein
MILPGIPLEAKDTVQQLEGTYGLDGTIVGEGNAQAASSSGTSSSQRLSGQTAAPGNKRQRENLPKAAVALLKSWMFEHITHPYPSDAEKNALMQVRDGPLGSPQQTFKGAPLPPLG